MSSVLGHRPPMRRARSRGRRARKRWGRGWGCPYFCRRPPVLDCHPRQRRHEGDSEVFREHVSGKIEPWGILEWATLLRCGFMQAAATIAGTPDRRRLCDCFALDLKDFDPLCCPLSRHCRPAVIAAARPILQHPPARAALRAGHLNQRTEGAYVAWIRRFTGAEEGAVTTCAHPLCFRSQTAIGS